MNEKLIIKAKYGWAWKVFCWVSLAVFNVLAWVSASRGETLGDTPAFIFIIALSLAITIPLILEFHFTEIRIEQDTIHTRSPWRKRRVIPFSSVASCDFSETFQWYRIRTQHNGVIRLHTMLSGLPLILWHLPCKIPRKPIQSLDADGNWHHPFDVDQRDCNPQHNDAG